MKTNNINYVKFNLLTLINKVVIDFHNIYV